MEDEVKKLAVFATLISIFTLSMACGSGSGGGGIEFTDFALKMHMASLDDIIVTQDGHYLSAGDTRDDDTVLVAKTAPDGSMVWQTVLNLDGFRIKLAEVSDGYLVFIALEIPSNGEDNDAMIVKLDFDGNFLSRKRYTNGHYDEFKDVCTVGDRVFSIVSIFASPGFSDNSQWLAEFDSTGAVVSGKKIDLDEGVDDNCSFYTIACDGTDTYLGGAVYIDGDGSYLMLAKLDETLSVEWCKYFGTGDYSYASDLLLHPDGGVLFAGGIDGFGEGDYDGYVAHFDADGDIQWQMTYGTPSYDDIEALSMLDDGTLMLAGYTEGSGASADGALFVAKLNESHVDEWSKVYGYEDIFNMAGGFAAVEDKGFVVNTFSSNWDDQQYAWLMSVNSTGEFDDTVPYIFDMPQFTEWVATFTTSDLSLSVIDHSLSLVDHDTTTVDDPRTIEQVYPEL